MAIIGKGPGTALLLEVFGSDYRSLRPRAVAPSSRQLKYFRRLQTLRPNAAKNLRFSQRL
ncbi:MAG: hypothetical protein ACREVI_04080 [Steroidobacteraceae bacterium]